MSEVTKILATAEVYGIISSAFKYPEDDLMDYLRNSVGELAEAMELLSYEPETIENGMAFANTGLKIDAGEVRHSFNEFYTGRKQASMDESEYDTAIFYRYQRIADIAGFYGAFGFEISEEAHMRPDFIGTELEFMCLLLLKRAYAVEQGWNEQVEVCLDAERKFFSEHMEWWIPKLCETIRGASNCEFYRLLSNFLESFIHNESSRYLQPA